MAKRSTITRRDFLNGVAITGLAAGMTPMQAMAQGLLDTGGVNWTYPPEKTGMRGSHAGSYEVAHGLAMEGMQYDIPKKPVDRPYDLIIVGGGISGLSAAMFAQEKLGKSARILVLDNHDDFGGHAKRNEFEVDGKKLIGYGGSQSIDSPGNYSDVSKGMLKTLGIETDRFYRHFDRSFGRRNDLKSGLYLNAETYGQDQTFRGQGGRGIWGWETKEDRQLVVDQVNQMPFSDDEKDKFIRYFVDKENWLPDDMSESDKREMLRTTSYVACLKKYAGFTDRMVSVFVEDVSGFWGCGWDSLSGLEAIRLWHTGAQGLNVDPEEAPENYEDDEPYIFHFPDGNAAIPRLMVANLVPDAVSANDMDGIVKARVHYDRLDRPENTVRIRLMSTVIDARNTDDGGTSVTYVRDGKVERAVAPKTIMACYNHILPHIMPDMAEDQKEALNWPEKIPLAYINVAIRNWHAFKDAGLSRISTPGTHFNGFSMDFPVSMGGYSYANSPDEPTVIHMTQVPTMRGGLDQRVQAREGRMVMLGMTIDDYEDEIKRVMNGSLGQFGFDADRDIAAITVNRWPHGYAYEYNELFDDYDKETGPHVLGRRQVGNISIANSDSQSYAYVNGAIDAAARAISELYG